MIPGAAVPTYCMWSGIVLEHIRSTYNMYSRYVCEVWMLTISQLALHIHETNPVNMYMESEQF